MAVQNAALTRAATGLVANVTALSLHTAAGGGSGNNQLTGGDYEQEEPSYGSVSSGSANLSSSVTFGGPASSSTVTHLGFWDGSTWLGSVALVEPRTLGPGDTLTVTSAPIVVTAS